MAEQPEKKPPTEDWIDPYTHQQYLSPKTIEALLASFQKDPQSDLVPIAGACLVELYKEQFTVKPAICYSYKKEFVSFPSSFSLIPAKGVVGGLRAFRSMATALDRLNDRSTCFDKGYDLIAVSPPARKDGRMLISVCDLEEILKLIREHRPDIYQRAETSLKQGTNYEEGTGPSVGK